jgi:hypothetical protein
MERFYLTRDIQIYVTKALNQMLDEHVDDSNFRKPGEVKARVRKALDDMSRDIYAPIETRGRQLRQRKDAERQSISEQQSKYLTQESECRQEPKHNVQGFKPRYVLERELKQQREQKADIDSSSPPAHFSKYRPYLRYSADQNVGLKTYYCQKGETRRTACQCCRCFGRPVDIDDGEILQFCKDCHHIRCRKCCSRSGILILELLVDAEGKLI